MQAVATGLASAVTAWSSSVQPTALVALVLVAFVACCVGCCCGLGWGLLLGSWAPQASKALVRAGAEVATQSLHSAAQSSRVVRRSARPAHLDLHPVDGQ